MFFILEIKEISHTTRVQKGSSRVREGRGDRPIIYPSNLAETLMLESILAKRCICSLGGS